MVHRVVANDGFESLVERAEFNIVNTEPATDLFLPIDWWQRIYPLFANLDELRTDIDAGHIVTEAGEEFAQPAGTTGHLENPGGRRQVERDPPVPENAEMPGRLDAPAVAPEILRL